MTIELTLLISGLGLAFAVYSGLANMRRNQSADDRNAASQLTTVIVKLEHISAGINEIKAEMSGVKADIMEDREKIIRIEEMAKQAHTLIDTLEKNRSVREGESSE